MVAFFITAGTAVCIAFLAWWIIRLKSSSNMKPKTLEECFGEPVYADVFTFEQMKTWIKGREDKIKNGCKAIVMKVNEENIKSLGKIEITDKVNKYLVMAVVDKQKKSIEDSLLVKYISLDDALEKSLEKGNGTLVVGG